MATSGAKSIDNNLIVGNTNSGNKPPLFTIITVVRNGELTLERCIRSVKNQTFQDFEYLIIDGASSDQTHKIIKQNSDIIDYSISETDEGLYFAMNKGLKLARGSYIGILNADDIYSSNTLELVQNAIKKYPNCDVIYGAMRYFDEPNQIHFIHSDELSKRMIFHPTCFISIDAYKKVGYFNTKYQVAADYDFILRCRNAQKIFLGLENVLATFNGGGISSKLRFRSIFETSEIQAKYNFEPRYLQFSKLMRILIVTYFRVIINKVFVSKKISRARRQRN
jgi:glycosyltransferase involved in cell wall biosynthesis